MTRPAALKGNYFTYTFVFLCEECGGPAPLIVTYTARQPEYMTEQYEVPCSCGHHNRQSGKQAVHVTELSFQKGVCSLLHIHTVPP
jgi:hypothetical protein